MAEFKLNPALASAVEAVKAQSGKLGEGDASLPNSSLSTAQRYAEQDRQIHALMQEYQALIQKDMNDIAAMIRHVQEMDANMAQH